MASDLAGDEDGLRSFLETVYARFHHDFRGYAMSSLRRRLRQALPEFEVGSILELEQKLINEPAIFGNLLAYLTVQVSDMFRDPTFYKALREKAVPILRTYPSLKIWVAGCSTGEEVWSLAILLREEELLDRTVIYATDINPDSLRRAEAGVYRLDRLATFTKNHQQSGGKSSLCDYYQTGYDVAVFDKSLKSSVVFADHSLATDSVFTEAQLVTCRNVLIYFRRELQERALNLFAESLCPLGILGLGSRETLSFSPARAHFTDLVQAERIYRKS